MMSASREFRPVTVELEYLLARKVRPEAARRDMTVSRLVVDLLDVIVSDELIDAVLDDQV
ncbi:MAG TPA: hypothetical protein VF913_18535 [Xanthobacteraceae bacterium]